MNTHLPGKAARAPDRSRSTKRNLKSYFITDRKRAGARGLMAAIEAAVFAGVDLIQIREKDLGGRRLEELTREAVRVANRTGSTKILVNDRLDVALASGASGLHVPVGGLPVEVIRRLTPKGFLIGVSTHSLEEARRAAEDGADFIVFGPVFPTPSKPAAPGVGTAALAAVTRAITLPVYALGGMTAERVDAVAAAGAAGIAGISVFTRKDSREELMDAIRRSGAASPGTNNGVWIR